MKIKHSFAKARPGVDGGIDYSSPARLHRHFITPTCYSTTPRDSRAVSKIFVSASELPQNRQGFLHLKLLHPRVDTRLLALCRLHYVRNTKSASTLQPAVPGRKLSVCLCTGEDAKGPNTSSAEGKAERTVATMPCARASWLCLLPPTRQTMNPCFARRPATPCHASDKNLQ